jgi:hypothetical protein
MDSISSRVSQAPHVSLFFKYEDSRDGTSPTIFLPPAKMLQSFFFFFLRLKVKEQTILPDKRFLLNLNSIFVAKFIK